MRRVRGREIPGNVYGVIFEKAALCEKCPNTEFFSGQYFPIFGLNMEVYSVNLRIQSEYREIRIRKNSVFRHFSRSELLATEWLKFSGIRLFD